MTEPTSLLQSAPFALHMPEKQGFPFIFNSPHSGCDYPESFIKTSRLNSSTIRRSEDAHVDKLFKSAPELGVPLMCAHYPRAFIDLNREPYELDPRMFSDPLPPFVNKRSPRVISGLGTIPKIVADKCEIYRSRLPFAEARHRIDQIYRPYHDQLRQLMTETFANFGLAILIDCHSMPSRVRGQRLEGNPDFILGDRYSKSCSPALMEAATEILTGLGYRVAQNYPYAGGFITEHYGQPQKGLHALQIEINRACYMDEATHEPNSGFLTLQNDLAQFMRDLIQRADEIGSLLPLAAE